MWFENLNYTTAIDVKDTIQDQLNENKIKITDLTKEKLTELKVDILDNNSYLNIRDKNWNDIGNLKEDGKILKFLWWKEYFNGNLFLEVQAWNIKGYVSADYVKGNVNIDNHIFKEDNSLIEENNNQDEDDVVVQSEGNLKHEEEPEWQENNIEVEDSAIKVSEDQDIIIPDIIDSIEVESDRVESIEEISHNIDLQFNAFKYTIKRLDTTFDTQSSSEKISNKEFLDANYNSLILLLKNAEIIDNIDLKNKINDIKLYLSSYYADEWEVENSNFNDYQLSTKLAFDVLGKIEWINEPPTKPDMWEIISSFKWTWIWTYIISKINDWTEVSEIFSSKIVKDATEEKGEELINKYEDDLEEYLEFLDDTQRWTLSDIQNKALDLLMDINWAWWSVKNSTTDIIDLMSWDFASMSGS